MAKTWQKSVLAPGTIGTMNEYKVALDLLVRGFEVFRSVSQHCSCDMVALKEGRLLRVEVKTAYRLKSGRVTEPTSDPTKWDILAMVLPDKIVYRCKPEAPFTF